MQGEPAGVSQRQRVEVVDQSAEHLRLLQQRGEMGVVAGVDVVQLGLDAALEDGQGSAKLVRHVGEEPAPLGLRVRQSGGHVVERGHEGTHLAGPIGFDPNVVVAGAQAVGGAEQTGDRPADSPVGKHGGATADDADEPREEQQAQRPPFSSFGPPSPVASARHQP
ncbi:MAG: hypothetical protein M3179_07760, partial [Actinomycetota bacterium]|nr:hypothetical protein [Actinomycetota bacterium]